MDRFYRGLIAGIAGGIAMNLWSLITIGIFGWEVRNFVEWAGVILYGELPRSYVEGLIALVIQLLWVGFLGIILAFIITKITSREYIIKGIILGVITGFIIYAAPVLLQTPYLFKTSLYTVVSNQVGGLIWGVVTAQALHWLDSTPLIKS